MFAGIVEALGKVVRVGAAARRAPTGAPAQRLDLELGKLLDDLQPGASVAVNGVCLTLAGRSGPVGAFDVIPETWCSTNLRTLRIGDPVNIERSLRVGDRLDGHFVQGHVDGVGRVERIERGAEWKLWVTVEPALLPFIVRKGSIALDGTSLTIVDVGPAEFSVALIPTTLERTVLGRRRPGDLVNVETDILARLVVARLVALGLPGTLAEAPTEAGGPPEPGRGRAGSAISFESLREGGYL